MQEPCYLSLQSRKPPKSVLGWLVTTVSWGAKLLSGTTPENGITGEEVRTVALGEEPRGREDQDEVPLTNPGIQDCT